MRKRGPSKVRAAIEWKREESPEEETREKLLLAQWIKSLTELRGHNMIVFFNIYNSNWKFDKMTTVIVYDKPTMTPFFFFLY